MATLLDEIKNGNKKPDPLRQYVSGLMSGQVQGNFDPSYGSETAAKNGYDQFMAMFNQAPNLTGAEKLSVGAVNLGKGVAKPFTDTYGRAKSTVKGLFKPVATGKQQQDLLDLQAKVQELDKQGKISDHTKKIISHINPGDTTSAYQYILAHPNDDAGNQTYLNKLADVKTANDRKALSDAAQIAMTFAAPANAIESAAGKTLAPRVLGGIVEGGLYGAASTYEDPKATFEDYVKNISQNAAIAGAAPVAFHAVGSAARVPSKVLDTPAGAAVQDAIAPYVSKIDQTGRAIIDKAKNAAETGVRALPGGGKTLDRVQAVRDKFKQQLIDSNSPIYDRIRKLEKSGMAPAGTADALYLKNSHIQGNKLANEFIDSSPAMQNLNETVSAIDKRSNRAIDAAGQYSAAKSDLELAARDKKAFTPEQIAKKQKTLADLEAKYGKDTLEASHQALIDANKEVTKLLKDNRISEAQYQKFLDDNPNYTHVQRVQKASKLKEAKAGGGRSGAGEPLKRLDRNATQEQLNPLAALHQRIQGVHQFVAANEFKKNIAETFVKAGTAKAERTTENVTKRQAAMQFLADTREGKKVAARTTSKYARELRVIQSELDKLNKKGLDIRLADAGSKTDAPILSGVRDKLKGARTVEGKTTQPLLQSHAVTGTVESRQFSRSMTAKETRDMVANIISEDPKALAKVRRMIETRDTKAAAVLADLTDAAHNLEAHNTARGAAYNDILNAKDGTYKGKTILTYYDKGVKNVVSFGEQDAAVVHALKGLDKQQMNAVMNAARVMNNVFKYGTTQGNPAFAIPNYIRDQIFSSITSESTWRTHNPFVATQGLMYGLMDGLGLKVRNEEWNATKAAIEGAKRIDINRNMKAAVNDIIGQVKDARPLSDRLPTRDFQFKSDAQKTFGKINGLISGLETATRFQNYKGTKALYLAKGADAAVAGDRAALAALRNSVDFGVSGDLGKVMNTIIPYFNAAIQGPRTLLRSFSERPVTTSAKFALAATPILYSVNYNLSDPERARLYADTPEYVRQNNLIFISGNNRFLIPIPKDLAGLYSPIRKSLEAHFGLQGPSAMSDAKDIIGALTPIQTNSALSAVSSILPGPIKAGLEIGANKNFYTGKPIVPDSIKSKNDVPSEQYYRDANGKPKGLSGMTLKLSKMLNISPLQLEHFQTQTLGEVGGPIANNTIDQLSGSDTVGGRSITDAIKRRFVYSGGSEKTNQFYGVYTPALNARSAASSQVTTLIKEGKRNEAARRAQEFNDSIEKRFEEFRKLYGDNPAYEEDISKLKIPITDKAFNSRAKAK